MQTLYKITTRKNEHPFYVLARDAKTACAFVTAQILTTNDEIVLVTPLAYGAQIPGCSLVTSVSPDIRAILERPDVR